MKKKLSILLTIAAVAVAAGACSFSTASMSSFKTSKDKEGKTESTTFKAGETLYANAVITGSMDKTTTKIWMTDASGKAVTGSEVKIDLPGSGTAAYSLPIPAGAPGGKYTVMADFLDDKGEKKDSKSVAITIEGAPAPPPSAAPAADDKDADKDDDK
ncbi:MAG: hypothetical protein KA746_06200 [Pyrinomonadaceae bacterium]|nr:hypothetical protein [Pyrinomonadaceae bacterium]